jgi:hypothetical protein
MKILLCIFLALGACQSDVDHADSGTLSAQDAPPGTHQAVVTTDPGHDDDGHGDSLQASGDLQILLLLALLIAAFLTTHFMVRMAGRRWFLALPGLPYLVVGLLVGPAAFEIISAENLESLQPAVTVAIGSIGLLAGLRLNFRRMWPHLEMEHVRSAAWIAVLTGVSPAHPRILPVHRTRPLEGCEDGEFAPAEIDNPSTAYRALLGCRTRPGSAGVAVLPGFCRLHVPTAQQPL